MVPRRDNLNPRYTPRARTRCKCGGTPARFPGWREEICGTGPDTGIRPLPLHGVRRRPHERRLHSAQGLEAGKDVRGAAQEACIRPLRHHRPASRSDERIRYRPPSGPLLLQLPRVRQPIGGAEESIRARRRRLLPRLPLRLRPQPRHPRPGCGVLAREATSADSAATSSAPLNAAVPREKDLDEGVPICMGFKETTSPSSTPSPSSPPPSRVNRMILDYDTAYGRQFSEVALHYNAIIARRRTRERGILW